MASRSGPLFVGIKGAVLAIDRQTGATLWKTELKGSEFVHLSVQDHELFAASRGRIYRLDPASGSILWTNDLPGLGWGIVSLAGGAQITGVAEQERRNAAAAATAAAT